jgi:hypothetical protein
MQNKLISITTDDMKALERGEAVSTVLKFTEYVDFKSVGFVPCGTPSSNWAKEHAVDPHDNRYDCERSETVMGHLTDDMMANHVFMDGGIMSLTAAKDRIRWLSRKLQETQDKLKQYELEELGMVGQHITREFLNTASKAMIDRVQQFSRRNTIKMLTAEKVVFWEDSSYVEGYKVIKVNPENTEDVIIQQEPFDNYPELAPHPEKKIAKLADYFDGVCRRALSIFPERSRGRGFIANMFCHGHTILYITPDTVYMSGQTHKHLHKVTADLIEGVSWDSVPDTPPLMWVKHSDYFYDVRNYWRSKKTHPTK